MALEERIESLFVKKENFEALLLPFKRNPVNLSLTEDDEDDADEFVVVVVVVVVGDETGGGVTDFFANDVGESGKSTLFIGDEGGVTIRSRFFRFTLRISPPVKRTLYRDSVST